MHAEEIRNKRQKHGIHANYLKVSEKEKWKETKELSKIITVSDYGGRVYGCLIIFSK